MTVQLLSSDPDFAALLSFLLERNGMTMSGAHPAEQPVQLLVIDLTDEDTAFHTAASAAQYAGRCPQVVLYRPAAGAAWARALLPQAAAYLTVPLVPRELVAV